MTKLPGYSFWELRSYDDDILTDYVFLRNEQLVEVFSTNSVGTKWSGTFIPVRPSFRGNLLSDSSSFRLKGSIGHSNIFFLSYLLSIPIL